MGSHRFEFEKSAIVYVCTTNRLIYLSGVLLQQLRILLEGVSAHSWNGYYTILKEVRGRKIFNLPASQQPLNPFSSNSVAKQNGGVLVLFSRFVSAQKITESKQFFAVLFQITSTFVLANKNKLGARCTLINWVFIFRFQNENSRFYDLIFRFVINPKMSKITWKLIRTYIPRYQTKYQHDLSISMLTKTHITGLCKHTEFGAWIRADFVVHYSR